MSDLIPEIGAEPRRAKPMPKTDPYRKVRIRIHESALPHAVDPVPVSVNGRQYTINRGQVAEVPVCVAKVLEDAVETHYEQVRGPDGATELRSRTSMAYPFSYV